MADIGNLSVRIDADTSGLERGAQRGRQELNELGGGMERVTGIAQKLTGVLAAMGAGIGFANAIREIANFQAAMNGLAAVSGATEQQMASLESQARTLGATSRFSAQQAAEGQRFLAQAGFSVNETLGATPGILQLATAAELDLGTAADIASNVLGGMRLEVDQLNRVNDVLAATASRSNTSISQLGQALSFAAPFAAGAGISIEEAAAAIGNMSDSGIQASRAGTGLVGTIRQLSNVTDAGEDVLGRYGLSVSDVSIEARGLQPVLETLRQANLSTADAIALFGSEAGAAAQVLVNDYSGAIEDATGEAERMANQLNQGLGPAFRSLQSAISESVLQMGDSGLSGDLEDLIRTSTGVISVFNGMGEEWVDANDNGESLTVTTESLSSAIGVMSSVASEDAVRAMTSMRDSWSEAESAGDDLLEMVRGISAAIEALVTLAGARLVVALGSATAAKVKDTAASVASARAEAIAAQAVTRRTSAELASSRAMLNTAKLEVAATRNTSAHAFALQQLSAARVRATNAAGAHGLATANATAAMKGASLAARGLSGALALVGGPIGLLVGAAGLLFVFRDELGLVAEKAGLSADEIDRLTQESKELSEEARQNRIGDLSRALEEATLKAAAAREELAKLRDENRGSGFLGFEAGSVGEEIRGMQAVAEAQERILEINQQMAATRAGMHLGPLSDFLFDVDPAEAGRRAAEAVDDGEEDGEDADQQDPARFMGGIGIFGEDENQAFIERLKAQLEMRQEILREFDVLDAERQQEKFESDMERLREALELGAVTEEEFRRSREEAEHDHWSRIAGIRDNALSGLADLSRDFFGSEVALTIDSLGTILGALSDHSKKAFEIQKAAAIATALVNAYKGISLTLATYPYPINIGLAAAHAAVAFAQISKIKSQSFQGGGGGSASVGGGAGGGSAASAASGGAGGGGTTQPDQNTIVTIQGLEGDTLLSSKQVRGLIEQINEATENGAKIRIAN